MFELESQVRKWRSHLRASGSLSEQDLEELESHLRDSIDDLTSRGITTEEAFLVSVRRLGDTEALGDEFAKVTTENLWRQLLVPAPDGESRRRQRTEVFLVIGLALLAGLLGKIPALFGWEVVEEHALLYLTNAFLFALPSVAIYLIWKRSLSLRFMLLAATVFIAAALLINLYPSYDPHDTAVLAAIHLPIALLMLIGILYGGPGWRKTGTRLDFVRFAGEVFIYSVLIALGGIVLVGVSVGVFQFVEIDIETFIVNWVAVFGVAACSWSPPTWWSARRVASRPSRPCWRGSSHRCCCWSSSVCSWPSWSPAERRRRTENFSSGSTCSWFWSSV